MSGGNSGDAEQATAINHEDDHFVDESDGDRSENLDQLDEEVAAHERPARASTLVKYDQEDDMSVDFSGPRYREAIFIHAKRNLNELKQEIEGANYKQNEKNYRDNKYEQEDQDTEDEKDRDEEGYEDDHQHRHDDGEEDEFADGQEDEEEDFYEQHNRGHSHQYEDVINQLNKIALEAENTQLATLFQQRIQ